MLYDLLVLVTLIGVITCYTEAPPRFLLDPPPSNDDNYVQPSLHRDGYGRPNPNQLLNGFFPVWPVVLLIVSGIFFIISIVGFVAYMLGCRPPKEDIKKLPSFR